MARQANPYAGTYSPSRMSISKEQLVAGLKSIKIKAPNRKYSETAYKSGLQKQSEGSAE